MAYHECFGKVLRPFQYGTSLRWANDGNILRALVSSHVVVDTFNQWVFGAYNHHVNGLSNAKLFDSFKVVCFHGYIFSAITGAGVAWGDEQFLTFLTLCNLPCQGMFATATA